MDKERNRSLPDGDFVAVGSLKISGFDLFREEEEKNTAKRLEK